MNKLETDDTHFGIQIMAVSQKAPSASYPDGDAIGSGLEINTLASSWLDSLSNLPSTSQSSVSLVTRVETDVVSSSAAFRVTRQAFKVIIKE